MKTNTRRQPFVPALPGGGRPGSVGSRGDINPLSAVIDVVPIACLVDALMRYGKHDTTRDKSIDHRSEIGPLMITKEGAMRNVKLSGRTNTTPIDPKHRRH
ncbi:hypothetical protein NEUTE1DRAFT_110518 [Neurospora tetrasperma FGSC 2508]|uniref:Uncharacterized protein n=1 Tax=Neurospora tetrasperma (strain FGSC 2508 / ATCC MYA-4615 / P0657) TaxID=510951 RepID=F8MLD3_NEUT8|nr:uncharacterized protein NEUTE1DRAFT_110518 [Neurospora tetrasperma FGSC 2508]EGO58406.1 hypothetical protein NEUTE1DRAFT_110518 [Neurospora tetrasperma FGSC 2508]